MKKIAPKVNIVKSIQFEDVLKIADSSNGLISSFLDYKRVKEAENTKRIQVREAADVFKTQIQAQKSVIIKSIEEYYKNDAMQFTELLTTLRYFLSTGDEEDRSFAKELLPIISNAITKKSSLSDILGQINFNDIKL